MSSVLSGYSIIRRHVNRLIFLKQYE